MALSAMRVPLLCVLLLLLLRPCDAAPAAAAPTVELLCRAGVPFRWRVEGGDWHETRSNRELVPGLDAQGQGLVYEVEVDASAGFLHRWSFHRADLRVIQYASSGYAFEPARVLDTRRMALLLALPFLAAVAFGRAQLQRSRSLHSQLAQTREQLTESEARTGLFPVDGSTPSHIDGYDVVARLGMGGMAVVYHVRRNGEDYAMKLPLPMVLDDADFRARFRREGQLGASIHHPGIVHIYDVNDGSGPFGYPYLVMEMVNGVSLKERLRLSRLDPLEVGRLGVQLLDALAHLHERGIVHRDIKPANVMIAANGSARLMDLGIAYATHVESGRLTRTGDLLGTPLYLAPEQVGDERQSTDPRIDVYGVGMMLYEALAGRLPWTSSDTVGVVLEKLSQDPADLSELAPHVPFGLVAVIMRMVARSPDARHASAAEAREALRQALAQSAP